MGNTGFAASERKLQQALRENSGFFPMSGQESGTLGRKSHPFLLPDRFWSENLFEEIRSEAEQYFSQRSISWHRFRKHLLSSQVCCLNFLMPFANRPAALAALLRPAIGDGAEMIAFDSKGTGGPVNVAFEWIGAKDYLNEGSRTKGVRNRGANCTSADAAVMFRKNGQTERLLIEWKYTESYGQPLSGGDSARTERLRRYNSIAFESDGPLKQNSICQLTDLFYEPFYQFFRQQLLAFQMQKAREAGCDRVRVLHIAPSRNTAFQRVTAPKLSGTSATNAWQCLLADQSSFISMSTESLFANFDTARFPELQPWKAYVTCRYPSLFALPS
jgi:hypothetical protein